MFGLNELLGDWPGTMVSNRGIPDRQGKRLACFSCIAQQAIETILNQLDLPAPFVAQPPKVLVSARVQRLGLLQDLRQEEKE